MNISTVSHHLQAVRSVSGKSADRLGYDKLNLTVLAVCNHRKQNSKWSVQKRFQNGTFIIAYPPYGYDNDNGTMVIVPEQA